MTTTKKAGKDADMKNPSNMQQIVVITDSGCEQAAKEEILRHFPKAQIKIEDNKVSLDGTIEDAARLGFYLQTARRVLIKVVPDIKTPSEIKSYEFPNHLTEAIFPQDASFKVEAEILQLSASSNQESSSITTSQSTQLSSLKAQDLISEIGEWSFNSLKRKVDLKKPDITIVAIATRDGITIGIDPVGQSLARREYRIMTNSQRGIKSTIAASMVIYANALNGKVLDPMPGDGVFCIEAALLRTKTSPRKFQRSFSCMKFPTLEGNNKWREEKAKSTDRDITAFASSMKEMKAIRTNSKLAGCDDAILSTKVSMDWMDVKLDSKSIDCIITAPPCSGRSLSQKDAEKLQDMLFNQAEYILKSKGTMACIVEKPEEIMASSSRYGFKSENNIKVLMGLREMTIIILKKGPKKPASSESAKE